MIESTTMARLPRYVALTPENPTFDAGSTGALLRDYLAILAFYLEQPGVDRSANEIGAAFDKLPNLLKSSSGRVEKSIRVTTESVAGDVAEILAIQLGGIPDARSLLPLTQPATAQLWDGTSSTRSHTVLEQTMLILQLPTDGMASLGTVTLSLNRQQEHSTLWHPAWGLSVGCLRTIATVVDSNLGVARDFVNGLITLGRVANLTEIPSYLAVTVY